MKSVSIGSAFAPPFSSSRRLASRSAAISATWCGWVRSTFAASARTRSLSRRSPIATGPVIASMRRTLAALEVSVVILKAPISAVARTCVPPHSSRDQLAVADLDHPHDVAVLLAEQGHRAEVAGLVERAW